MHELMKKVKKELDTIAEKGISSSNLETTNKLVDIYKDLKEVCEMEESEMYGAQRRGRNGRYMDSYEMNDYDRYDARSGRGGRGRGGNYGFSPMDERCERHLDRMRDAFERYSVGRQRYMDGGSHERMTEGIEMTMAAIVGFVESLIDFSETSEEKEIVRKYIEKMKKI